MVEHKNNYNENDWIYVLIKSKLYISMFGMKYTLHVYMYLLFILIKRFWSRI